jgi:DNA-binding beta-propeller fold protein YncE
MRCTVFWVVGLVLCATPGVAAAVQTRAFVVTTDFGTGGLSAVGLDSRAVTPDVASIHSDARARWHDGLLYVINRFGQDNIQVIDPAQGYATIRQFSTGTGSNPHDIAFVSPTRAYVTRYELTDVLIVNPQTGAALGVVPLGAFADADGIPEMDNMIKVGPLVFVTIQRLDRNAGFTPTTSSLVAVIDSRADTVLDVNPLAPGTQAVLLTGTQPFTDFAFDASTSRLLVGCAGVFGVLDGGIEWIDPVGMTTLGYAASEAALGGDVNDLVWDGPARSYAIVNDAAFNTSLIAWSSQSGSVTDTLMTTSGFALADAALDDRGELYVAKNDFIAPGVFVLDAATGAPLAGPLNTGLPPFQIVFDSNPVVASVLLHAAPLAFAPPWPNPSAGEMRLSLRLAEAGRLRLDVLDASGRRVARLFDGDLPPGSFDWRGTVRDPAGRRLPAGAYWFSARVAGRTTARRVVLRP